MPSTAIHAPPGIPNSKKKLDKHPHELVIDLGRSRTIRGFRYMARQDTGWNGTFARCEFTVSDSPDQFPDPPVQATLTKTKKPQDIACKPVTGRYVLIRVLSEINGNPWASAAELGVLAE